MISWDYFQKAIREVCLLTGQNPPKEQMQAIYRKIQSYDLADFLKACEDDQLLEEWAIRVNYPSLKRLILKYQIARQEEENAKARKKELEELKKCISNDSLQERIKHFLETFGR